MSSSGQNVTIRDTEAVCDGWLDEDLEVLCQFEGPVTEWADFETGRTGWTCPQCNTDHETDL